MIGIIVPIWQEKTEGIWLQRLSLSITQTSYPSLSNLAIVWPKSVPPKAGLIEGAPSSQSSLIPHSNTHPVFLQMPKMNP